MREKVTQKSRTPLRRPADRTQSRTLQLIASRSPNPPSSITVHPNSIRKGITVDPYDIEDTSDWLGSPTELETLKHYAGMLEEDIEALKLELRAAKENITGLITMNDELSADLQRKRTWIANLESETTVQLTDIRRLNQILHQREVVIRELQALKLNHRR
ncbi:hypothetical protein [Pseudomonas sp. TMW22090]|uniref:hypothetical protein n=1 Tax=Pseudomonas sp. TMW22090 TaxID=2506434 RepID=UPI001F10C4C6|nr:hypothetical protein [Pseudomonas sp. TMW22090]